MWKKDEKEEKLKLLELAIEEYINTPDNAKNLATIQKKYGFKRATISKHLKNRGYEVVHTLNRSCVNEHIFDEIDTEEKAYWLGFLYADGCVVNAKPRIELSLSDKDTEHLNKYIKFLDFDRTPLLKKNGLDKNGNQLYLYSVGFSSHHMKEVLIEKGCTPRKSLTLEFPKEEIFKSKDLIRHFIRGYCDGDGCLGIYQKLGNGMITEISFVGTENFLKGIQTYVGINGNLKNKSSENYNNLAFKLHYTNAKARVVARKLYENSNMYLNRKYNIYKEFCRFEEESSIAKSTKIGESCDANTEVNN